MYQPLEAPVNHTPYALHWYHLLHLTLYPEHPAINPVLRLLSNLTQHLFPLQDINFVCLAICFPHTRSPTEGIVREFDRPTRGSESRRC